MGGCFEGYTSRQTLGSNNILNCFGMDSLACAMNKSEQKETDSAELWAQGLICGLVVIMVCARRVSR